MKRKEVAGENITEHTENENDKGDNEMCGHDDELNNVSDSVLRTLGEKENQQRPHGCSKITDFFSKTKPADRGVDVDMTGWKETLTETHRKKFKTGTDPLKNKIVDGMVAGRLWDSTQDSKLNDAVRVTNDMQEKDGRPVLFGSDVVGLYPNLEPTSVARLAANSIRSTKVKFRGINYYFLIVYILLVVGENEMKNLGLSDCIPKKKKESERNIKSLAAELNRDMQNWEFSHVKLTDDLRVELLATMVQIMVLVLTGTTCYKFAGKIYRQVGGLGIGLRGSAALARIAMCIWDILWGTLQAKLGLKLQLFFRYVDDLRMLLRPLKKGWIWKNGTWQFEDDNKDSRTPEERTIQEVGKSLNYIWDFLTFTTEGERDFPNGQLPTLDFSTQVLPNGYISYQFFSKPMASNLVLQIGTALSRNCVFSSLRQDLVRRLINTDLKVVDNIRIQIVEQFIQLMVNSGHKYQYIKSVVLQAISKFTYMVERSKLSDNNKKYMPLHRNRSFDWDNRVLLKYTEMDNWYTGVSFKDQYRNGWKSWIKRKNNRRAQNKRSRRFSNVKGFSNRPISTAIFVPPTPMGKLTQMIQLEEDNLDASWGVKVVEKPGVPLWRKFKINFPVELGCYRGSGCYMCKGDGNKCAPKRVVYQAQCMECKCSGETAIYVGETARQVGERVMEHMGKVDLFKKDSFLIQHWMERHPLQTARQNLNLQFLALTKIPSADKFVRLY